MKKGAFSDSKIKEMLDIYLTPQEKQSKMITRLSTTDRWEARGEARGEVRGKILGEKQRARLTVLRGFFRVQPIDLLADLSGLLMEEVTDLARAYQAVKKAYQAKKVDIFDLSNSTTLSEEEVKYVLTCLESEPLA